MKLLATFGFLIAFGLNLYVATKQQQRMLRKIRSRNTGIVSYAFAMASLVLIFVEFWCLTGIFPYYVILLLLAASFVGVVIHNLIGAIAGFGLEQKKSKINILALILGAQRKAWGAVLLLAALVMLIVIVVGSLYKFWTLPVGSPEAVGWIAFFLFIVPQLFSMVSGMASTIPIMASEFVDQDLRNYFLSNQFSSVIYSTAAFIFPVWVFAQLGKMPYDWIPPGWVILSLPLLIFIFCYLLAYFVGANRHRSLVKAQLEWRREWLKDAEELLAVPEEIRGHLVEEKNAELQKEVRDRTASNELHTFIQEVESLVQSAPDPANLGPVGDIFGIILDNKQNLREWDMRFREVDTLDHLSRTVSQAGCGNLSNFVVAAKNHVTEDIQEMSKKGSLLAGGFGTAMSGAGLFLFKAYLPQLMALIGHLTGVQL
jgi:hypothetical protein